TAGASKVPVLQPMTSFGSFLFHDGVLNGYKTVIDGAQQIAPNVYRVRTGLDGRTVIQTRVQALEPNEPPITPDPRWTPPWIPGGGGDDGCGDWCPPTKGGFVGLIVLWMGTIAGLRRILRRRKRSV